MAQDLVPLTGGWATWYQADLASNVELRFVAQPDGHLEPVEIRVQGESRLTGESLRAIRLGRAEAAANEPSVSALLMHGSGPYRRATATPAMAPTPPLRLAPVHDRADGSGAGEFLDPESSRCWIGPESGSVRICT